MDKENLQNLDLATMLEGAVPTLFLEAMSEKVLPNLFDLNADPKKKRALQIEIEFAPTCDRWGNVTGADVLVRDPKVKLSPRYPVVGHILLGKIDGQYQAKEIKQMTINDDDEEDQPKIKAIKKEQK